MGEPEANEEVAEAIKARFDELHQEVRDLKRVRDDVAELSAKYLTVVQQLANVSLPLNTGDRRWNKDSEYMQNLQTLILFARSLAW